MADDPKTCATCGQPLGVIVTPAAWLHPTLLAGIVGGLAYVGWQLSDEWSKIQSFEIYTTPPGLADLLKLAVSFVVIVGASAGLNMKAAIGNALSGFGIGKEN